VGQSSGICSLFGNRGVTLRIEKIRRKKVWEEAADQIQALIVEGYWEQGERLPGEVELASQFGISRSALREAIRQLSSMGLIEVKHGEGNYVSYPSLETLLPSFVPMLLSEREDILAIMEARDMIEVRTAGLAASRATEDELERLEILLDTMVLHKGNPSSFAKADHEFHRQIALATKNKVIIKIFDAIDVFLVKQQLEIVEYEGAFERGIKDHQSILRAIAARDVGKATEAMQRHMDNTHKAIVESLSSSE
jgi:GntR family transcriptional repressor for pyruvate dehydrogenase complex